MKNWAYFHYTKYMNALLHKFDRQLTKRIQQWPKQWRNVMAGASFIGQPVFTVGTGALIVGIGFGSSNATLFGAGVIVIATISAGTVLKVLLRRDRPLTDYVLRMRFNTFSLPSGHSVGAMVAYGTLALLALTLLPAPFGVILAVLLGLLVILIGLSRIYLGAHYPSDVIAGWLLGLIGFLGVIAIVESAL
jgi:undecaprenyl-diphosphatase